MTVRRKVNHQDEITDDEIYLEDQIGGLGGDEAEYENGGSEETVDDYTKSYYGEDVLDEEPPRVPVSRQTRQVKREPGPGEVGGQLVHTAANRKKALNNEMEVKVSEKHLTQVGASINQNAEVRDGWIPVDRAVLGERSAFYPEDWRFMIRPATVEAIRNWSVLDEENWSSVDDVFNEVLKTCLAIKTSSGPRPWNQINSWDRFFFLLLVRDYTFSTHEKEITFTTDCPNCDVEVKFLLNSGSLGYEMPDPEVMPYFDQESQTWTILPEEFEVDTNVEKVTLYLPTLEKEANYKSWLIDRLRENRKYKPDAIFMKFALWLLPKISKDSTIARQQLKNAEAMFKSWDTDMFSFMDEVIKNITVTPATHLVTKCPSCGEECSAQIEFRNGIKDLFAISGRHKKFGKK